jgi:hypothetical protein
VDKPEGTVAADAAEEATEEQDVDNTIQELVAPERKVFVHNSATICLITDQTVPSIFYTQLGRRLHYLWAVHTDKTLAMSYTPK